MDLAEEGLLVCLSLLGRLGKNVNLLLYLGEFALLLLYIGLNLPLELTISELVLLDLLLLRLDSHLIELLLLRNLLLILRYTFFKLGDLCILLLCDLLAKL